MTDKKVLVAIVIAAIGLLIGIDFLLAYNRGQEVYIQNMMEVEKQIFASCYYSRNTKDCENRMWKQALNQACAYDPDRCETFRRRVSEWRSRR